MRHNTSNINTNRQVKWHQHHAIRRLRDVWIPEREGSALLSSLAAGPKIMSYLPMTLGIFIWTYDTQNVTPGTLWIQNPHTASMNFYCSNHISVVCETRFLHIVQSNQHITAGWIWKYIWQSSFLKLRQMLKRFTKIQIEPLFVMVWFGKKLNSFS